MDSPEDVQNRLLRFNTTMNANRYQVGSVTSLPIHDDSPSHLHPTYNHQGPHDELDWPLSRSEYVAPRHTGDGYSVEDLKIPSQNQRDFDFVDDLAPINHIRPSVRASYVRDDKADLETPEERRSGFRILLWPGFMLCFPMMVICVALVLVITQNLIRQQPTTLAPSTFQTDIFDDDHYLVNFRATRITFVAGFLSTFAQWMAGYMMALFALIASNKLRHASKRQSISSLPTPGQLGLLIGCLRASLDELLSYYLYLVKRDRRAHIVSVLHQVALVQTFGFLLFVGVLVADAMFKYQTKPVSLDLVGFSSNASSEYGRGLSHDCLTFDRNANDGWPCTMQIDWSAADTYHYYSEASRLAFNASSSSQIRYATVDNIDKEVAYIMPNPAQIPPNIDFQATTIGISTQCNLIPAQSCNASSEGPKNIYTSFACSDSFWGVLGMSPNTSITGGMSRVPDSNRPYLAYKPQSSLQYSFFADNIMQTLYNTVGDDDTGNQDSNLTIWSDAQLINPFYVAFAARLPTSSMPPGSELLTSNTTYVQKLYFDFFLNCAVSSHDLQYTWFNGSLASIEAINEHVSNGTVLEMFHGAQVYTTVSGGGIDIQNFLIQATISGNGTDDVLASFGRYYSNKVLSKIGSVLTTRTVLQEQTRTSVLASKIPKWSFGILVACSLLYPLTGTVLLVTGYLAASKDGTWGIESEFTLQGLVAAAFGKSNVDRHSAPVEMVSPAKSSEHVDRSRVLFSGDMQKGFKFERRSWI